jgi:hypothetical protein
MLSEQEQIEFARVLEFQATQEGSMWFVEGVGKTLDGMKVVKALIGGKNVYSIPKD